ncbi:MAG: hypothetical protein Q9224_001783 [Gallowayella concinna]
MRMSDGRPIRNLHSSTDLLLSLPVAGKYRSTTLRRGEVEVDHPVVVVEAQAEEAEVAAQAVVAPRVLLALLDRLVPLVHHLVLEEVQVVVGPPVQGVRGSSAKPSYGGGKYFGGGATRPYSSGTKSPRAGIVPLAIGIGAAAFIFPGIWIWGAYNYPYNHGYSYRNRTRRANNTDDRIQRRQDQNVTLPITCLCEKYSACGCDDNEDTEYLDSIIGDGTNLNESLVHIGPDENGQQTIALNGTLPNATDSQSDTSSGSSSTSSSPSSSAATTQRILESSGIWVIGAIVGATVWLL